MKRGNQQQRRHTLKVFCQRMLFWTLHYWCDVLLDKETLVTFWLLQSIKTILSKIFWCRSARITNNQHSFLNVIATCICTPTAEHDNLRSKITVSNQLGISPNIFKHCHKMSTERAPLILSGDNNCYELVDTDKVRSKFSNAQHEALETWIISHCNVVKNNSS